MAEDGTSGSTRTSEDESDDAPGVSWPLVERRARPAVPSVSIDRRRSSVAVGGGAPTQLVEAPALAPFRWVALAVAAITDFGHLLKDPWPNAAVLAALIAYAAYSTVRPIAYRDDRPTRTLVGLDVVVHLGAVMLTGNWSSKYCVTLIPSTLLAGFASGPIYAFETVGAAAGIISVRHLTLLGILQGGKITAGWCGVLALVALTSGQARRVSVESARQQVLAQQRVSRLTEANALLFNLQRVAQSLPASLDLDDVLDSTVARIRTLIDSDAVTVLLYSESDRSWDAVRTKGYRGHYSLRTEELPPPLREALLSSRTITIDDLSRPGSGLSDGARSGLYASLRARGSLVGLIAVEAQRTGHFTSQHSETVNGVIETFGVAIDNARLFRRLRSVGADEERSRIARELHDRIGSSLALLGYEVDRLSGMAKRGEELYEPLVDLRGQLTSVVSEVRETLYDLRTDVSDTQGLAETLTMFCERVRQRTGLEVNLTVNTDRRLAILQERELWQIAREAITNTERHAEASELDVEWRCTARIAALTITDNGRGFTKGTGRPDSYGLLGMRERAASVNAVLEIESEPGKGTKIRVSLGSESSGGHG